MYQEGSVVLKEEPFSLHFNCNGSVQIPTVPRSQHEEYATDDDDDAQIIQPNDSRVYLFAVRCFRVSMAFAIPWIAIMEVSHSQYNFFYDSQKNTQLNFGSPDFIFTTQILYNFLMISMNNYQGWNSATGRNDFCRFGFSIEDFFQLGRLDYIKSVKSHTQIIMIRMKAYTPFCILAL